MREDFEVAGVKTPAPQLKDFCHTCVSTGVLPPCVGRVSCHPILKILPTRARVVVETGVGPPALLGNHRRLSLGGNETCGGAKTPAPGEVAAAPAPCPEVAALAPPWAFLRCLRRTQKLKRYLHHRLLPAPAPQPNRHSRGNALQSRLPLPRAILAELLPAPPEVGERLQGNLRLHTSPRIP